MANSTSKTSKAKTKTTKRPATAHPAKVAAKSTKVTKLAKAERKPAAKVSAEPVAARATPSVGQVIERKQKARAKFARPVTAGALRRWHLISAAVFALLAAAAAFFMNTASYQLVRGHLTSDALLSKGSTVFVPAQHAVASPQLRWLIAGILAISAILSFVRYRYAARERQMVDARISPWRWFDLAITGAMMVQVVALMSGMQDIVSLEVLGALTVASIAFAWIAERENANAPRMVRGAFVAHVFSSAVVFLSIAAYAVATYVYGMIRSPWYVYALYAVLLVLGLTLVRLQLRAYRHVAGERANYLSVDRDYQAINLLVKAAFTIILIAGLHR